MEPSPTPKASSASEKESKSKGFTVGLEPDASRQVAAQAKKLKISKSRYASAAISYFAQSGLDPTSQEMNGLISVRKKVGEDGQNTRKWMADVGNRIVAIVRAFEGILYKLLQGQQANTFAYLERIEANILAHQVEVESRVLAPMLERIVKANVESFMNRRLLEILILRSKTQPYTADELSKSSVVLNKQRDEQFVLEMRELLKTATVTQPQRTPIPAVTPIPTAKVATPDTPLKA
ncbi:MAG: hypothetical protein ACRYFX_18075 [Janthinobacterium lividum]